MNRRLLRLSEVSLMTAKSRSSIYADPTFPKPIKIGKRSSAWLHEEIDAWIEERLAARKIPNTLS